MSRRIQTSELSFDISADVADGQVFKQGEPNEEREQNVEKEREESSFAGRKSDELLVSGGGWDSFGTAVFTRVVVHLRGIHLQVIHSYTK